MNHGSHYLLYTDAGVDERKRWEGGRWRFVLEPLDGADRIEAEDVDNETRLDRLNLLAVVRGLEALDGPSRVTLLTMSWYVRRGFSEGLELWRQNDFQWETFGQWTSVTNEDLWRRVDRALQFHSVQCRTWRFDAPEAGPRPASACAAGAEGSPSGRRLDPYRAAVRRPKFLAGRRIRPASVERRPA